MYQYNTTNNIVIRTTILVVYKSINPKKMDFAVENKMSFRGRPSATCSALMKPND